MIAAIYARKSTEQTGVADEQKSVARQVEHAREEPWIIAGDQQHAPMLVSFRGPHCEHEIASGSHESGGLACSSNRRSARREVAPHMCRPRAAGPPHAARTREGCSEAPIASEATCRCTPAARPSPDPLGRSSRPDLARRRSLAVAERESRVINHYVNAESQIVVVFHGTNLHRLW